MESHEIIKGLLAVIDAGQVEIDANENEDVAEAREFLDGLEEVTVDESSRFVLRCSDGTVFHVTATRVA